MHGMTLLQMKRPSTALYYFKSAMMLAEFESNKLEQSNQLEEEDDMNSKRDDMSSKKQELGMFMQQVSTMVMGIGKQVFIEAHQSIQSSNGDVDLIYAAIQYAHAVNKLDVVYRVLYYLDLVDWQSIQSQARHQYG